MSRFLNRANTYIVIIVLAATFCPGRGFELSQSRVTQKYPHVGQRKSSRSTSTPRRTVTLSSDAYNLRLFSVNDGDAPVSGKGTARITGTGGSEATSAIDYVLSLLSSDVGSIVLGLLGLTVSLWGRLSHLDYYDSLTSTDGGAAALGAQSRADLLGVFAAGAVLLNGVSKLDVTSALAESVVLEGISLGEAVVVDKDIASSMSDDATKDLKWAMESALDATPARTVVLMIRDNSSGGNSWRPAALAGTVPADEDLRLCIPESVGSTPILDKFLKSSSDSKESYLPTLQALPGRVEFTYLPANAQEALLIPVPMKGAKKAVLVLASDTAKSCTPRDVAWCQVLATQMGNFL